MDGNVGNSRRRARHALLAASGFLTAACLAAPAGAGQIKTVFVIAMENHNWPQPGSQSSPQQIY